MDTPTFRAACRRDLPNLLALEAQFPMTDRVSLRSYRRFIDAGTKVFVMEMVPGHLAGSAILLTRQGGQRARLYSLVISPDHRRQGLAGRFLTHLETTVAAMGLTQLRLEVRESNASARALYAKHGFHVTGRRRDFYGDGEAATLMEKTLAPLDI